MIPLTVRPIKVWPDGWQTRTHRASSPFQATYSATLDILDRELHNLHATEATLQVDCVDADVRLDGRLRADAKVRHPGVILTIETKQHGTLGYATDRFDGTRGTVGWQANLRAIALGLEALRKIERYGIAERGQQYAGYRELGAGMPMGPAAMTLDAAAELLIEYGEVDGAPAGAPADLIHPHPLRDQIVGDYYRRAAKRHHPDTGGDPDRFRTLTAARDLLLAAQ